MIIRNVPKMKEKFLRAKSNKKMGKGKTESPPGGRILEHRDLEQL